MFRSRSAAYAVVLGMLVGGGARGAAPDATTTEPAPPPPRVEFRDGRLSVDATDVPTMTLLARIGDVTGAEVSGTVAEPPTVTISFHDVPMRQAIDRIVRDNSFTLRYGADGSLRRITLRGLAGPAPPPAVHGLSGRRGFQRSWLSHPPLVLDGPLAQALGRQRIALPHLLRSVRTLQDRGLRRQAVAKFVRTVEGDADLRASWRAMTASDLASFARQQAGPHAQETLGDVAATTRNSRIRVHATTALGLLARDTARPR